MPASVNNFVQLVIKEVINPILVIMAAVAFVGVLWGILLFIQNAQDGEKRAEGRKIIIYGVFGLVIIFGAYGIINTLLGFFGLDAIHPITGG